MLAFKKKKAFIPASKYHFKSSIELRKQGQFWKTATDNTISADKALRAIMGETQV